MVKFGRCSAIITILAFIALMLLWFVKPVYSLLDNKNREIITIVAVVIVLLFGFIVYNLYMSGQWGHAEEANYFDLAVVYTSIALIYIVVILWAVIKYLFNSFSSKS